MSYVIALVTNGVKLCERIISRLCVR